MKGYEVVTSDDNKIGKVVEIRDGFLVVETGFLRGRRPLPQEFAHTTDDDRRVVVTVSKRVLQEAPRVKRDGTFDVDEARRHYGLGGAIAKEETVWTEEATEHQRAAQQQRAVEETGIEEEGAAPLTQQPEDEIERRPERVYMPGGK